MEMLSKMAKLEVFLLAGYVAIVMSAPADAYLDPATGAALSSAIMGFFAAIYFTLKKYYHKIKRIFRRNGTDQDKPQL
jgi:O-antigen/teichoic acid export membrane protein